MLNPFICPPSLTENWSFCVSERFLSLGNEVLTDSPGGKYPVERRLKAKNNIEGVVKKVESLTESSASNISIELLTSSDSPVQILNGPTTASCCLFSVFSNKQYNFYNKSM